MNRSETTDLAATWSPFQPEREGAEESLICDVEQQFQIELPHSLVRMYRRRNGGLIQDAEPWGPLLPLADNGNPNGRICPLAHWACLANDVSGEHLLWAEQHWRDSTRLFPLFHYGPKFYALHFPESGGEPDIVFLDFALRQTRLLAPSFEVWMQRLRRTEEAPSVDLQRCETLAVLHHEPAFDSPATGRDAVTAVSRLDLESLPHEFTWTAVSRTPDESIASTTSPLADAADGDGSEGSREQWLCFDGQELIVFAKQKLHGRWNLSEMRFPEGAIARELIGETVGEGRLHLATAEPGRVEMRHSVEITGGRWLNRRFQGYPQTCLVTTRDDETPRTLIELLDEARLLANPEPPPEPSPTPRPGLMADLLEAGPDALRVAMSTFDPDRPALRILRKPPRKGKPVAEMNVEAMAEEGTRWMRYFAGGVRDVRNRGQALRWINQFADHLPRLLELMQELRARSGSRGAVLMHPGTHLALTEIERLKHHSAEAHGLLRAYYDELKEQSERPRELPPRTRDALQRFQRATELFAEQMGLVNTERDLQPFRGSLAQSIDEYVASAQMLEQLRPELSEAEAKWIQREIETTRSRTRIDQEFLELISINRRAILPHWEILEKLSELPSE